MIAHRNFKATYPIFEFAFLPTGHQGELFRQPELLMRPTQQIIAISDLKMQFKGLISETLAEFTRLVHLAQNTLATALIDRKFNAGELLSTCKLRRQIDKGKPKHKVSILIFPSANAI